MGKDRPSKDSESNGSSESESNENFDKFPMERLEINESLDMNLRIMSGGKKPEFKPTRVSALDHDVRQQILKLLIDNELTIMQLSQKMDLNPGTVQRHLKILMEGDLVPEPKIITNQYGFKEKYYRAKARKYTFYLEWPSEKLPKD